MQSGAEGSALPAVVARGENEMRLSRKIRNAMRRERRANPSAEDIIRRQKTETPEKRSVRERAEALQGELKSKGVTWAACVQAIKTDWIAQLKNKHRD
tara:strand:+ start:12768 stop:13061 length:294 start_codon:yes stop_codon:yes gene_type:complete